MELHLTLNEPGSHRRISNSRGPVRRQRSDLRRPFAGVRGCLSWHLLPRHQRLTCLAVRSRRSP